MNKLIGKSRRTPTNLAVSRSLRRTPTNLAVSRSLRRTPTNLAVSRSLRRTPSRLLTLARRLNKSSKINKKCKTFRSEVLRKIDSKIDESFIKKNGYGIFGKVKIEEWFDDEHKFIFDFQVYPDPEVSQGLKINIIEIPMVCRKMGIFTLIMDHMIAYATRQNYPNISVNQANTNSIQMWLNKYNEDKSDKKKFIKYDPYDQTYILDLKKA
jgi:hypothetical protein